MNNYCTNCGKRLGSNEIVCKRCNTPIIDLPLDYKYVSPNAIKTKKRIFLIILIIILTPIIIYLISLLIRNYKMNNLKNNYVKPYLLEKYHNNTYQIKYKDSGKCIIAGDCYYDIVQGCDGGSCEEYTYLPENECKSYYFSVDTGEENITITVFYKDNKYTAIEGENIYGIDEDDYYDDGLKDAVTDYE